MPDDPLLAAAAVTLARDQLWRNLPPLTPDCDHDLELLPIMELRQTMVCRKCGGLDVEASRRMLGGRTGE